MSPSMNMRTATLLAILRFASGDQTDVTADLNSQIESGGGAYNKGKGVLVRTPDFFSGGTTKVVPASFWVNDIVAVSTLYPSGNPWCPHASSDGFESLSWVTCQLDKNMGPWNYATVAAVIGRDYMRYFFKDFDSTTNPNIQSTAWGWGVFYATDANSCDKRCRYDDQLNGWNCPGGWMDNNGKYTPDSRQKGAGDFDMGNPTVGLGGGGAGCHFDQGTSKMDQVDAYSGQENLVQDGHCQCNYIFADDWTHWVDTWIAGSKQKPGFEWRNWLGGSGKLAPSWAVDPTICWVNNPRDMIRLQNALYYNRYRWNNGMAPLQLGLKEPHQIRYWGWNEVPVERDVADDPKSWTAVMIKLPAAQCGHGITTVDVLSCLQGAQYQLEIDLGTFVSQGKLKPGAGNIAARPGSYVVIVREQEYTLDKHTTPWTPLYKRIFYCENWVSPNKKYKIVFQEKGGGNSGTCYLDYAGGATNSSSVAV